MYVVLVLTLVERSADQGSPYFLNIMNKCEHGQCHESSESSMHAVRDTNPGSLLNAVPEKNRICVSFGISAFVSVMAPVASGPAVPGGSENQSEKQVLFDVKASVDPGNPMENGHQILLPPEVLCKDHQFISPHAFIHTPLLGEVLALMGPSGSGKSR